jgi:hypothetical protein
MFGVEFDFVLTDSVGAAPHRAAPERKAGRQAHTNEHPSTHTRQTHERPVPVAGEGPAIAKPLV